MLLQACNPKRITAQRALLAGFFLTGVLFTGIKTLPVVNIWVTELLSHLYGPSVRIALDSTDCMALLVFLPARVLWQRVEQQKEATAPDKLTYFALAAGSLAALATAPCAPAHQVTRLASDGGTLYAGIGTSSRIEDIGIILASTQGWEDWHVVMYRQYNEWRTETQYETIAKNPFNELRQLPITVCEPSEPTTCYRIDGTARVEISEDGGKNWATAWQADPAGRTSGAGWLEVC